MLDRQLAWRLTVLRNQICDEVAAQKFLRVGRAILARMEEAKYRPDQPRAPRGTPIGGQWIDDPQRGDKKPDPVITVAVDCMICGKKHIMKLTPLSMCQECLVKEYGGLRIHVIQAMLEPSEDEDPDK